MITQVLALLLATMIMSRGQEDCNAAYQDTGTFYIARPTGICINSQRGNTSSQSICNNGVVYGREYEDANCITQTGSDRDVCAEMISAGERQNKTFSCSSVCDQNQCDYIIYSYYSNVTSCDPIIAGEYYAMIYINGWCYRAGSRSLKYTCEGTHVYSNINCQGSAVPSDSNNDCTVSSSSLPSAYTISGPSCDFTSNSELSIFANQTEHITYPTSSPASAPSATTAKAPSVAGSDSDSGLKGGIAIGVIIGIITGGVNF
eukprot:345146_1